MKASCLSRSFGRYAQYYASRYPRVSIAVSAFISAILASGIFLAPGQLIIDSDPDKIWVPPGTPSALEEAFFNAAFDPFYRVNQAIISLADPTDATTGSGSINGDGGSAAGILQKGYFQSVLSLQEALTNTPASDGTVLSDICFKPIQGRGCLVETPLDYFRSNASTLAQLTPPLVQDALLCRHILGQTSIPCVSDIGVPELPQVVLGGTGCPSSDIPGFNASVCGGCGKAAQALMLTFLLENTEGDMQRALNWEKDVFLKISSSFSAPGLKISYYSQRSITDELEIVETQNQFVIAISYAAMLLYIALALGKFPHPIATRALLGLQGVFIVGASVAVAFGIAAWIGLHITMIVTEVVPFLILAIGVDNMFIISKAIDRRWSGPTMGRAWGKLRNRGERRSPSSQSSSAAQSSETINLSWDVSSSVQEDPHGEEGLGSLTDGHTLNHSDVVGIVEATREALSEVGPTITAAAACEILAFGVGITTMVPALQQFCAVAAIAVSVDYVLQLTWFLPAVILDARRQEARRLDLAPCVLLRGGKVERTQCACFSCCCSKPFTDVEGLFDDEDDFFSDGETSYAESPEDIGLESAFGSDNVRAKVAVNLDPMKKINPLGVSLLSENVNGDFSRKGLVNEDDDDAPGGCCDSRRSELKDASLSKRFWACINRGGFVRSCMARGYAPFLMHPLSRAVVFILWASLLGASFVGVQDLRLGLEQQLVLPTGSYLSTYFSDQARLGEAGPPIYLVLQNINYTHPDTSSAVANFAAQIGGLSNFVVAPVYSWISDFEIWSSPDTLSFVTNPSNAGLNCPIPLSAANFSYASRVAQYVYEIEIESACCQQAGYCGGQYATDIKFLWGVPKLSSLPLNKQAGSKEVRQIEADSSMVGYDGRVTAHVTKSGNAMSIVSKPGMIYRSIDPVSSVDDGGCDLSSGYLLHSEVDRAVEFSSRYSSGFSRASASKVSILAKFLPSRFLEKKASMSLHDVVDLIPCHVMTSRLRTQHTPLRNQTDFINSMNNIKSAVSTLQLALPQVDLNVLGINSYGPLVPGSDDFNTNYSGGVGDNQHSSWLPPASSDGAFPYSLFYVYYEQYGYIRGTVINMILISLAAVFLISYIVSSLRVAAVTTFMILSLVVSMCGFLWMLNPPSSTVDPSGNGPYGVDINAVSVVNLVTATGLGVEFIIHIAFAFFSSDESEAESKERSKWKFLCLASDMCSSTSSRSKRSRKALVLTGSSVVTGITLTKLSGVLILASAPSQLFRLYYFRMYLGIVLLGAFHGLAVLPVILASLAL